MLKDMTYNGQVEVFVPKGYIITIKQNAAIQGRNVPIPNPFDPGRRYFQRAKSISEIEFM